MPVHAAREHAATEAPARGGGDDPERSPTGFAQVGLEAYAQVLTNEWAASFMHGFNNPDTVRASNLPRTGSSPLSDVRGPVPLRTKQLSIDYDCAIRLVWSLCRLY